jgi:hypothetical protein
MLVRKHEHNLMQPTQHVLHLTMFTSLRRALSLQLLNVG